MPGKNHHSRFDYAKYTAITDGDTKQLVSFKSTKHLSRSGIIVMHVRKGCYWLLNWATT